MTATIEGIRSLKQNASAVVARAAAGEVITITDRGRPVAQLGPIQGSAVSRLIESGQLRPARHDIRELAPPAPLNPGEESPSAELARMRDDERY